MTGQDHTGTDPWWASGRGADDGLDGAEDPFDAFHRARQGTGPRADDDGAHAADADPAGLLADAVDLLGRLASEAGRRVAARATANAAGPPDGAFTRPDHQRPGQDEDGPASTWQRVAAGAGPHADGSVCDACPVCITLRALRQARPDVVAHLSDAAHHVSLALRAFADAQTEPPDDLRKIDLDP